jgi:hypothetical protein
MNAGPDVERSIAQWLAEESPGRAPDRILTNAASTIVRTKQRRFLAAWREPMNISLRGIAVAAAVVVVLMAGAAWLGRSTATTGAPGATSAPAPSPAASPVGATIESYRAARDAVCTPLVAQLIALNDAAASLRPITTPSDIPAMITNLQQIVALGATEVQQLGALQAPPNMAAEQAADVTRHGDSLALLREAITKLQAGDATAADGLENATEPLSRLEEAFAGKYGLGDCP